VVDGFNMSFGVMIDPSSAGGGSTSKVDEAIEKFNELIALQKKVDDALAAMPEGADKARLLKERDSNRGFFQKTIIPAWNRVRELIGYPTASANTLKGFESLEMGVVPAVAWYAGSALAISAAVGLLAYLGQSIYAENKILNDPSLTASQKLQALQSRGLANIFSSLSNSLTMLAVVGGGAFLAYQYFKRKSV
jgi:hypothetical protein